MEISSAAHQIFFKGFGDSPENSFVCSRTMLAKPVPRPSQGWTGVLLFGADGPNREPDPATDAQSAWEQTPGRFNKQTRGRFSV